MIDLDSRDEEDSGRSRSRGGWAVWRETDRDVYLLELVEEGSHSTVARPRAAAGGRREW